jgi:AcrR family transcriptional regulator
VTPAELGRYRGLTGEERRRQRYERLLEAAIVCYGVADYEDTTIRTLCREAGLNERYFYESFNTREDLLFATYERVVDELTTEVVSAVNAAPLQLEARCRAGLSTFFGHLTADVRRARILSIVVVGVSPRLERRRRDTMHAFATFINQQTLSLLDCGTPPQLDAQLTARSLVGATNELLIDWLVGDLDQTPDLLVEHGVKFYAAAARAVFPAGSKTRRTNE